MHEPSDPAGQPPLEVERLLGVYRTRLETYPGTEPGFDERWLTWCRKLLTHGGQLVVPPHHPEANLEQLLTSARVQHAVRTLPVPGDQRERDANVAWLWSWGLVDAIVVGYALFPDGLWRPYCWGQDRTGTVVETFEPCLAYAGMELRDELAFSFALTHNAPTLTQVLASDRGRAEALRDLLVAHVTGE
jgi:hypothetical protein